MTGLSADALELLHHVQQVIKQKIAPEVVEAFFVNNASRISRMLEEAYKLNRPREAFARVAAQILEPFDEQVNLCCFEEEAFETAPSNRESEDTEDFSTLAAQMAEEVRLIEEEEDRLAEQEAANGSKVSSDPGTFSWTKDDMSAYNSYFETKKHTADAQSVHDAMAREYAATGRFHHGYGYGYGGRYPTQLPAAPIGRYTL